MRLAIHPKNHLGASVNPPRASANITPRNQTLCVCRHVVNNQSIPLFVFRYLSYSRNRPLVSETREQIKGWGARCCNKLQATSVHQLPGFCVPMADEQTPLAKQNYAGETDDSTSLATSKVWFVDTIYHRESLDGDNNPHFKSKQSKSTHTHDRVTN